MSHRYQNYKTLIDYIYSGELTLFKNKLEQMQFTEQPQRFTSMLQNALLPLTTNRWNKPESSDPLTLALHQQKLDNHILMVSLIIEQLRRLKCLGYNIVLTEEAGELYSNIDVDNNKQMLKELIKHEILPPVAQVQMPEFEKEPLQELYTQTMIEKQQQELQAKIKHLDSNSSQRVKI